MDIARARQVLGLEAGSTWEDVRAAYRVRIASTHPDREGGSPELAVLVNEAYAVLRAARAQPLDETEPAPPGSAVRSRSPAPAEVLEGDTIHLPMPADEAFTHLVEACHRIGDVTYIDRSCAILEALVRVEGEGTCSLVVSLQGRADGTDAFCTLEAIEHVGSPPVGPVVAALVAAM